MSASHPEADFALTAPGIASTANGCQPTPFSIRPAAATSRPYGRTRCSGRIVEACPKIRQVPIG